MAAIDTSPSTPADTNPGVQSTAAATGGPAAAAPGGAATYSAENTDAATSGTNVFANIQVTGSMPASAPDSIDGLSFDETVAGTAAAKVGTGKGTKRPDITRLSDLVKLMAAVNTGQPLTAQPVGILEQMTSVVPGMQHAPQHTFDQQVLNDVAKEAHLSKSGIQQFEQGSLKSTNPEDKKALAAVNTALWDQITQHAAALGVKIPPAVAKAPNAANALNKLHELGGLRLEQPTLDQLKRQGYDTSAMTSVSSLVNGHDLQQFQQGAPGTTTVTPGTPAHAGTITGADAWDDFVTNWNNNEKQSNGQNFRDNTVQSLIAIGALDTTNGNPTAQDVADAYQSVMQQAAQNKQTIAQTMQTLFDQQPTSPTGKPLSEENVNQAYVEHVADAVLGPNALTPFQAQSIANMANKVGTGSAAADDLIQQAVVGAYAKQADPITTGSSYAAVAYQNVMDTLQDTYGVPVSLVPTVAKQLVDTVLQSGVDTPYQIASLSQAAAEGWAKQNIGQFYGQGVSKLVNSGQNMSTISAPYLATASSLLGVPSSEMNLSDPTGKWSKWTQGQDGEMMTQQQWASYLMSDPSYGFQNTQTAHNQYAEGAAGLLQFLGKMPSEPNPFSNATLATAAGSGSSSGAPAAS